MNYSQKEFESKTTYITDARGRLVDMIDPINQSLVRRHGGIDGETLGRLAEEIQPGARRRLCWVIPIVLGGLVIALAILALNSRTNGRLNWDELVDRIMNPVYLPVGAYMLFVLPWTIIQEKRKRKNKTYAVLLKYLRCPHCGYSLQGLSVDATDGATVCPECACAWKLDDSAIEAACSCRMSEACGRWNGKGGLIAVLLAVLLASSALLLALFIN